MQPQHHATYTGVPVMRRVTAHQTGEMRVAEVTTVTGRGMTTGRPTIPDPLDAYWRVAAQRTSTEGVCEVKVRKRQLSINQDGREATAVSLEGGRMRPGSSSETTCWRRNKNTDSLQDHGGQVVIFYPSCIHFVLLWSWAEDVTVGMETGCWLDQRDGNKEGGAQKNLRTRLATYTTLVYTTYVGTA